MKSDFLPKRAREALSRRIKARNAMDRTLADIRLGDANDPRAARFAGPARHAELDAAVDMARLQR